MTTQITRARRRQVQVDPGVLDALNHHIAVASDLRAQVKQAHWTVVGPNFIAIHRLFDEQAAMLTAHIDLLAERMRALQAVPRGTLRAAIEKSDLPDIDIRELPEQEAISTILERFETCSHSLTEAIEQCGAANDLATQDLFIDVQREVDLQAYFLRSHLPGQDVITRQRRSPVRESAHSDGHR